MPFETIAAFQDHGECARDARPKASTRRTRCSRAGRGRVDYDDVARTLEPEGVQKFSDSFASLLEGIDAKRAALV